jgi:hypothetical protein
VDLQQQPPWLQPKSSRGALLKESFLIAQFDVPLENLHLLRRLLVDVTVHQGRP